MRRFSLSLAGIFCATTAIADTPIERFEALADQMSVAMLEMMINDIERQGGDGSALRALDGMMPPWDDAMREAGACIMDSYEAEVGADEVSAMLDRMDAVVPTMPEMTMDEFVDGGTADQMLPAGISESRSIEINRECGMMQLQLESDAADAFMAAMIEAGSTVPDND